MQIKLEDAKVKQANARKYMNKTSLDVKNFVKENTYAWLEFKRILHAIWLNKWNYLERETSEKIVWLSGEQSYCKGNYVKGKPKLSLDVKYKDCDMEDNIVENKEPKNDDIDDEMSELLSKQTKFAVFNELNEDKFDLAVEETFAKVRYDYVLKKNKDDINDANEDNPMKLNFKNIRATDMKGNKRVELIKSIESEIEIKLENLKIEFKKTFNEYKMENKDIALSNLTETEKSGSKKIKVKSKNKDLIVVETDKSKKLSATKPDVFLENMKPNIINDKIVTESELNKTIKVTNETK